VARDMGRLSAAHTVVGIMFAGVASIAVAKYGTVGLVAANCVAMCVRAIYAVSFAAKYFVEVVQLQNSNDNNINKSTGVIKMFRKLLGDMFPKRFIILAFLISFGVTRVSLLRMEQTMLDWNVQTASGVWYGFAIENILRLELPVLLGH
jgi:hypothetical protein